MSKQHQLKENIATRVLATGTVASLADVPKERSHFRALVVGNPNYVGNLGTSPFAPVVGVKENKTYEEIKCVGFHPQAQRLDAVVFVKQSFGYGGGICSSGTQEYLRFYISFDDGATWVDQGVTGFTANDVPAGATGGKRLEYAVSVPCSPPKKFCMAPNTILARAVLSWQHIPPANTPFGRTTGRRYSLPEQRCPGLRRWTGRARPRGHARVHGRPAQALEHGGTLQTTAGDSARVKAGRWPLM